MFWLYPHVNNYTTPQLKNKEYVIKHSFLKSFNSFMEVATTQFALPTVVGDKIFIGRATAMDPAEPADVANKQYVDSYGSGNAQMRIIYLSTAGPASGATADGLRLSTAFNDIDAAIVAANSLAPTVTSEVVIWCSDAGTFEMVSDHTLANYVNIYAPHATLKSSLIKVLTASPTCHITLKTCRCVVVFTGAIPAGMPAKPDGVFEVILMDNTLTFSGSGIYHMRTSYCRGAITCLNSVNASFEGCRYGNFYVRNTAIAKITGCTQVGDIYVFTDAAADVNANMIGSVTAEAGTTINISTNNAFNLTEDLTAGTGHRVSLATPFTVTDQTYSFVGPWTAGEYFPSITATRSRTSAIIEIPSFGGPQAVAAIVSATLPLPNSPMFDPGAGNAVSCEVICIDNGALCIGTFAIHPVTNMATIVRNDTVNYLFSGIGDLIIGPISYGYQLM